MLPGQAATENASTVAPPAASGAAKEQLESLKDAAEGRSRINLASLRLRNLVARREAEWLQRLIRGQF